MAKIEFRKIFAWIPWITLLVLAGWGGLFVLNYLHMNSRDVGILVVFFIMVVFTFAVDSLMTDNPENTKKYFFQWLMLSGVFIFFALTIYVWYG
ncbi:MAG: hypothetical protein ACTSQI_01930 [Candidatus Helarchaeota archaeon]